MKTPGCEAGRFSFWGMELGDAYAARLITRFRPEALAS
jgi:hypothetical protein